MTRLAFAKAIPLLPLVIFPEGLFAALLMTNYDFVCFTNFHHRSIYSYLSSQEKHEIGVQFSSSGPIELQSSAQLFGPGFEARTKHRVEAFAEFGSLRVSVSSLELGLYTGPKREGLVVALSAEIGDLNVAGPAV